MTTYYPWVSKVLLSDGSFVTCSHMDYAAAYKWYRGHVDLWFEYDLEVISYRLLYEALKEVRKDGTSSTI